jgi:methyl-accepting chemotaxis protein
VATAEKALAAFTTQFKATVANVEELAKIRTQLDATAAEFVQSISAFITGQDDKLAKDIDAQIPAEKLQQRRLKIKLGNDIFALVSTARVTSFKAQALRKSELLDKASELFVQMEALRQKLLPITYMEADLKELADVGYAAASYKAEIEAMVKNLTEAQTIKIARTAAANELNDVVGGVLDRSIKRTLDYAQTSASGLTLASRSMIIGLMAMVLLGLVAAFIIIRGVSKALTQTAETLTAGSLQVAAAAGQVSASSQAMAEGASEQAASLEEISSSIEELASMTKRNAENAVSGKTAAAQARAAAEAGAAEMERMQAAMNAIQQSSTDIGKIIKTIDEIAFQTNILALNAAVEAARAGEAGAGFAVVADEVRSLAQRSALAARETADKIADAIARSGQGVELSARVSVGLQEILSKSREVDRLVTEVATASNEQSEGISQINMAISQMDKVTQSNAAGAEETASAAEELNAQSEELRNSSAELAAMVGLKTEAASPKAEARAQAHASVRPIATVAASAKKPANRTSKSQHHDAHGHTAASPAGPKHSAPESLSFRD